MVEYTVDPNCEDRTVLDTYLRNLLTRTFFQNLGIKNIYHSFRELYIYLPYHSVRREQLK